MANEPINPSEMLPLLQQIYDRQHYFVDRHETMGEKLLNVLVLTGGLVSIVFTLAEKLGQSGPQRPLFFVVIVVFFCLFITAYVYVSRSIRPLSSKAAALMDSELLPSHNKPWIKTSLVYYRGILQRAKDAAIDQLDPVRNLQEALSEEHLCDDLSRQIIILAYYSDYKRKHLEKATKLTMWTVLVGIIALMICVMFIYIN